MFDTNIFVSALTLPGGQAEKAVLRMIEGTDTLLISKDIIGEILSVLSKKFSQDGESLSRVAVNLAELGELVETKKRLHIFDDEYDNRILECAVSGNADVIVTGDKAMLKLRGYRNIKIITLREYLGAA